MRELREETGLTVRVLELIEALDRILPGPGRAPAASAAAARQRAAPEAALSLRDSGLPVRNGRRGAARRRRHYGAGLCREEELPRYALTPAVIRVVGKAFAMARARAKR